MQEAHPIGDLLRETHLVGRHHDRHAFVLEFADHVKDLPHQQRVEGGCDLVEEHHFRLHRQRTHDGHALLLAAGETIGIVVGLVQQAEPVEQPTGRLVGIRALHPEDLARGQGHIVEDRHVREEIELLEHDADAFADLIEVDVGCRDLDVVDADETCVHRFKAVDAAQQRRLARP